MYMYFLYRLLGFVCIDGVTFGEGVKRGEGVTHGYKTETAKYVRVQHMQQSGGGETHTRQKGGNTHISRGQRYVRTYYLSSPPSPPYPSDKGKGYE